MPVSLLTKNYSDVSSKLVFLKSSPVSFYQQKLPCNFQVVFHYFPWIQNLLFTNQEFLSRFLQKFLLRFIQGSLTGFLKQFLPGFFQEFLPDLFKNPWFLPFFSNFLQEFRLGYKLCSSWIFPEVPSEIPTWMLRVFLTESRRELFPEFLRELLLKKIV